MLDSLFVEVHHKLVLHRRKLVRPEPFHQDVLLGLNEESILLGGCSLGVEL